MVSPLRRDLDKLLLKVAATQEDWRVMVQSPGERIVDENPTCFTVVIETYADID